MLQKLVTGIESKLETLVYSGSARQVHTGCNHPKVHPVVTVNGYPPGRLSTGDMVSCQTKDEEKLFSFRCIVDNVATDKQIPYRRQVSGRSHRAGSASLLRSNGVGRGERRPGRCSVPDASFFFISRFQRWKGGKRKEFDLPRPSRDS
jgi:hypothetical protein